MIDYSRVLDWFGQQGASAWADELAKLLQDRFTPRKHGDYRAWRDALEALPVIEPDMFELNKDVIRIGSGKQLTTQTRTQLLNCLRELIPWRKGPFDVFSIFIDTEWRSDLKWERLRGAITPLKGRAVLDVGCGSGYHCWRMAGDGARMVVGIEPMLLYVMQYQAIRHYITQPEVYVLPLGSDELPADLAIFDTVFSMGLLYHRRKPQTHLKELHQWLRPDGELVLETMVIEGGAGDLLKPKGRYASMRNVFAIPSCDTLQHWLAEAGFTNIRLIDVSTTTQDEQRQTDWMRFQSLADFLDPADPNKTIEGYPAPRRAIFIANV